MQIELLRSRSELAAIVPEWNQLWRPSTMQSPTWLMAWWDAYQTPRRELAVVTVRQDGRLVGLAPWYAESSARGQRIRWLGDGRVCSDHATILANPADRQAVAHVLATWVAARLAGPWSQLILDSVNKDDILLSALLDRLAERRHPITRRDEPGTCPIDLPETWDDYLRMISKNHRKKCRRAAKRWLDTGRASVHIETTPGGCCQALQQLVVLHRERRQQLGESNVFDEVRFAQFHQQVVADLATQGDVELRVLHVDGRAVAAEYILQQGTTRFAYQSGLRTEGVERSVSVLSLLTLVQDSIAAGYQRLDLLRGTESYKFSWGATHREAQTVTIHAPTTVGRVTAWYEATRNHARQFKRNLVAPTT